MGRRRSFRRHMARVKRRGLTLHGVVGSTLGVGLTLATPEAWAQTPSPSAQSKDDVPLPGINVQGERDQYNQFKIEQPSLYKLPDPIQETPQSITVIPEKIMEERAFFTLRDALRTVPGVAIAAGEGGGRQGDNLTLRGFGARNAHAVRAHAQVAAKTRMRLRCPQLGQATYQRLSLTPPGTIARAKK